MKPLVGPHPLNVFVVAFIISLNIIVFLVFIATIIIRIILAC